MKPKLSIIILSFNTQSLLEDCLKSLEKLRREINFETIVVDNASSDRSTEMVAEKFPKVKIVKNSSNLGFAKGNNSAKHIAKGKYILFLNSDTVVYKNTLKSTIEYMDKNKDIGALTCKLVLPNGKLDLDARRSFPTPWVAFTHFSHLDRVFPKSNLFARYWYGYKSPDIAHEVDVLQGAYFLTRKEILDSVGWFDEDYFLDGEDIDLSWKIKRKGWKIVYYPGVSILHVKGASKGKNKTLQQKPQLSKRLKFVLSGVNSMEIFYKKHLYKRYSLPLNILVFSGIQILKLQRIIKTILS